MGIGSIEIIIVINHWTLFNGTNLKILAKFGTITTIVWMNTPSIKLPIKNLFSRIPVLNIDCSLFILNLVILFYKF